MHLQLLWRQASQQALLIPWLQRLQQVLSHLLHLFYLQHLLLRQHLFDLRLLCYLLHLLILLDQWLRCHLWVQEDR